MEEPIESLTRKLHSGVHLSGAELTRLMRHRSIAVRGHAIEEAGKRAAHDDMLLESLLQAAVDPDNRIRLMGHVLVSFVALEALLRLRIPEVTSQVAAIMNRMPATERSDLTDYLDMIGLISKVNESDYR